MTNRPPQVGRSPEHLQLLRVQYSKLFRFLIFVCGGHFRKQLLELVLVHRVFDGLNTTRRTCDKLVLTLLK